MTRAEILTEIGQRTNKNPTLDASTKARFLNYVNGRHNRLLAMPGAQHLRDQPIMLGATQDFFRYSFPNIAKVNRVTDLVNRRVLDGITFDQWRTLAPDPTVPTGRPSAWAWEGYFPVKLQPADASELFVKSTSAADTAIIAYADVLISGNYPATLSKTLTGTTAVSFDTGMTTAIVVEKFYLSAAAAGTVTLTEDSGVGTELSRIPVGKTSQQYYSLILWPTPSASVANAYRLDCTLSTVDLAQDTDVPRLPEDFHRLLVFGALMDEYQKLDDQRYIVAAGEYGDLLRSFKYWMHSSAAEPTSFNQAWELNRLGAWYPGWRW